jgi:nucleoside-diphosphate-sugar epimerase
LIRGFIELFFKDGITGPINLGNPEPINILDLANEIIDLAGSQSKIEMRDLPGDDPKQREPDISKASEVLNWKPQINRKSGLLSTIEYFKQELNLA